MAEKIKATKRAFYNGLHEVMLKFFNRHYTPVQLDTVATGVSHGKQLVVRMKEDLYLGFWDELITRGHKDQELLCFEACVRYSMRKFLTRSSIILNLGVSLYSGTRASMILSKLGKHFPRYRTKSSSVTPDQRES